jgi:3-hydroxy-9,10-secoandrosta-1,3,5(10)-triene-9,17-dione monooxygenase
VAAASSSPIPIPEPDLTPEDMLGRAAAMRPILRDRQNATETAGRMLDETNADFLKNGFYRTIQPRRFGGYEFSLRDFIRIMSEIARGCPSSGWTLALTAGHPHMLSHFTEEAQREIYGATGDVRAPARPVPGGQAEKAEGGYVVSGAWDYASNCDHATHFVGTAVVAGSNPPHLISVIFDRSTFAIVDNWNTIGLRGTGSKRVAVERVFVPAHRTISAPGLSPDLSPGFGTHANPLYSGAFFALLFFEIGAVALGIARGALDVYEETMRTKRTDVPPFTPRAEQIEYQHHFGQAIGMVDLAEAALLEASDRYLAQARRAVEARQPVDETGEEARRILLIEQQVVRLAGEVVELLFRTSGTSGARVGSPLATALMAMAVMRTHMGLQWDRTMENVARLKLGMAAGFL